MASDSGSKMVKNIILERLPATLVLFGTADVFLFILAVLIALSLSRKYGSFFDKLFIALAPTSSAPGWFYGIFLILIFAALLHWLPFGGLVDAPPPSSKLLYALSLLKHMILPVAAITLSQIFLSAYTWRTFFLIYSSEDYVDMAKAKGLTSRNIERSYILRPTLPTIITSFALLVIGMWTGAPIFETVFQWPGLGRALFTAVGLYDTPVIVGSTVTGTELVHSIPLVAQSGPIRRNASTLADPKRTSANVLPLHHCASFAHSVSLSGRAWLSMSVACA